MGILDRYATDEDKDELARNLKLPVEEKAPKVNTTNKKSEASGKNRTTKVTESKRLTDNDLLSVINEFVQTYKESDKTSRMIRVQDTQYRKLVSLRADGISVSRFISFAVHLTLESKDYDTIMNHLKQ
ncbi:hypothetical protein DRF65_20470 [Chryseobacterium pennae]|uniref:DUF3408 domain-containing protein n=1 Tax=Chryseobacterium pennae TaxID=2258962 RepID=A0A3D9C3J5_9FLAO|nr:hypothetical protein [Chryseobacterium pennae]REC60440.1 hypothetical protein DRF65_20470 [Chryseobacterium pennae]